MLAIINNEKTTELPQDLYIPPDALRVFLETFEGPLDLLLYLIRKQNLDILSLPIAKVTEQYMQYIELMQELQIELAAEYLLMVAILTEIKSRMLLPRSEEDEDEEDPRMNLVRRLIEYERFKRASDNINELARVGRNIHEFEMPCAGLSIVKPLPKVQLQALINAYQDALERARFYQQHEIVKEPLLVRDRINTMLRLINSGERIEFKDCFTVQEGVAGVIVSFLALLELMKAGMIVIVQSGFCSPIYLRQV